MSGKKIFDKNFLAFGMIVLFVGTLSTAIFFLGLTVLNLLVFQTNNMGFAVAIFVTILFVSNLLLYFLLKWLIIHLLAPSKNIKLNEYDSNE